MILRIPLLVLFVLALGAPQEVPDKRDLPTLELCQLIGNWKEYHRKTVRVSAIYFQGAEQTLLYDPGCREGTALTFVIFQSRVKGQMKELKRLVKQGGRARVVFEGIFYGPEPVELDPRLPSPIKERLEGKGRTYGHMGFAESMIEVTRVIRAEKVADDVP